jgi:ubiquinone/menaquinone biosynthesis C-methylase UbiE
MLRSRSRLVTAFARAGLLIAVLATVVSSVVATAGGSSNWSLDIDRAMDLLGIKAGMVVGEAGAGDGYFTIPLAHRLGAGGVVYANDISRRALDSLASKASRERLQNVQVVEGTTDDARFPRHDLEMVIVVHAFHDFDRPVEWLQNLRKYLKPGGSVAIVDLDPAQGASSHFWTRERILAHAAAAGYDAARVIDDIPRYHLIVLVPRTSSGRPGQGHPAEPPR